MKDLDVGILAFLQLAIVLAVCRVVGWLGRKYLGQTQVVGEMIAGVMIGPSLFGHFFPELQAMVFPIKVAGGGRHPNIQAIYVMSQIGLALYMFLVGVEFDAMLLKVRAKSAAFVSLSGIVFPFILGVMVAVWIHGNNLFFPQGIDIWNAALYLGASMCITAFPMLARIIREQGIAGTSMGTLALAAGASDDVFAWCLLAIVLAVTGKDMKIAAFAIGGGLLYALFMFTVARQFFTALNKRVEKIGHLDPDVFAIVLCTVMLGAWITDYIKLYAVFGAFICGAAIPKGMLATEIQKRMEPVVVSLLLPLFFIFSGLNTRIDLLNTPYLWLVGVAVTVAAILGKGLACTLAAKATGEPWRESWAIGTLMNSRGLMELIIVNIGLQAKVITQELFTVLVLMAIVTTLMASPLYAKIMKVDPNNLGKVPLDTVPAT